MTASFAHGKAATSISHLNGYHLWRAARVGAREQPASSEHVVVEPLSYLQLRRNVRMGFPLSEYILNEENIHEK